MGRPFDQHIDEKELDALVPSTSETGKGGHALAPDAIREAERHVGSCAECTRKVSKYRQLVGPSLNVVVSQATSRGANCPKEEDVDWHEVAAGLWPELKARQLIMHAALCDHCGPKLRAITSVDSEPTPQEEKMLSELKAPSRPISIPPPLQPLPPRWKLMRWLVPAIALLAIVGVISTIRTSSSAPLSGAKFAEVAVKAHKQHAAGNLVLDVRSDSQQKLNEWLKENSPFSLALPASPEVPGEVRPYHLEGARLVQVGGKPADYIAYQVQSTPAGLLVVPDSVAVASGGVEVDFTKVRFHYSTVEGYKVVTWSVHGLTYALVSQEGNSTQRSCMVCHSSMGDRDLSQTPTPLRDEGSTVQSVQQ